MKLTLFTALRRKRKLRQIEAELQTIRNNIAMFRDAADSLSKPTLIRHCALIIRRNAKPEDLHKLANGFAQLADAKERV